MSSRPISTLYSRAAYLEASRANYAAKHAPQGLHDLLHAAFVGDENLALRTLKGMNPANAGDWKLLSRAVNLSVEFQNDRVLKLCLDVMKKANPERTKAELNAPIGKPTHLHAAAHMQNPQIARVLLQAGADPSLLDEAGASPLTYAYMSASPSLPHLLKASPRGSGIDQPALARLMLHGFSGLDSQRPFGFPSFFMPYRFIAESFRKEGARFFPGLSTAQRGAITRAFHQASMPSSAPQLLKQIRNGDLTLIPSGARCHAASVFFYTPKEGPYKGCTFLGVADRAAKYDTRSDANLKLYLIDPTRLREEHIQALLDSIQFDRVGTKSFGYIHKILPDELRPRVPTEREQSCQKMLDALATRFEPKNQKSENCTANAPKAALRGIALLMQMTSEGCTDEALHAVHRGVKGFSTHLRERSLKEMSCIVWRTLQDHVDLQRAKAKLAKRGREPLPPPPPVLPPLSRPQAKLNFDFLAWLYLYLCSLGVFD